MIFLLNTDISKKQTGLDLKTTPESAPLNNTLISMSDHESRINNFDLVFHFSENGEIYHFNFIQSEKCFRKPFKIPGNYSIVRSIR